MARLDVRQCITCHIEHRPEITEAMGLTLPVDFCHHCHANVVVERPTHRDMSFDTCASAGCHNYHDNRSLYEDFLVRHGNGLPATIPAALPERKAWILREGVDRLPLTAGDADRTTSATPELIDAWAGSAHASAAVACSDCHRSQGSLWADHPSDRVCGSCHELEPQGFVAGKHGMRRSADFNPMTPSQARLPMQPDSMSRTLNCGACHDVHAVNVRHAAVDACLSCHADEHSLAYSGSPHFRLWQAVLSSEGEPGSGVSCASCHLPRERRRVAGEDRIVVQHNQNANLRPNEKMIRDVCLTCHSLTLAIDALADPDLVRRNFVGLPSRHVRSIDMALSRKN
ncbi:MAG: cytochrome c3 family protein [Acidobacteriota bacterium]|nr:cytochrome c3 family protein [Acidobacteriota bacterium]